jgi:hypothetical protein
VEGCGACTGAQKGEAEGLTRFLKAKEEGKEAMAGVLAINGRRGAGGLLPSRGGGRFIKRRIKGGRAKEAGESGRRRAAVQSRGDR